MSETFDANRRLAEIALWADGSARWLDRATGAARAASRQGQITITLDRAELEGFVSGFQGIARVLLGLAQPVPPPIPVAPRRLRLVT